MDALTPKTPAGRIPHTALRNHQHEALAHAFVQGKSGRDAGLEAGYKDGPGLKGNIARLRTHNAALRERIAELAAHSAELAEIYDGWVLADVAMFARASLSRFVERDDKGNIVLEYGLPKLDFSRATENDYRLIEELSHTKYGPKLKLRDPTAALDKLMRHRGLLRDKVALTDADGTGPALVRFVVEDAPASA